jgi:hypothetical protein
VQEKQKDNPNPSPYVHSQWFSWRFPVTKTEWSAHLKLSVSFTGRKKGDCFFFLWTEQVQDAVEGTSDALLEALSGGGGREDCLRGGVDSDVASVKTLTTMLLAYPKAIATNVTSVKVLTTVDEARSLEIEHRRRRMLATVLHRHVPDLNHPRGWKEPTIRTPPSRTHGNHRPVDA